MVIEIKGISLELTEDDEVTEDDRKRAFFPRNGALKALACRDKEVMLSGPAGTGKSRTILEKLYGAAMKYPGMRGAIVRQFRNTLNQSAKVTFEELVMSPGDGVRFHTGEQEYQFPNGSVLVVAGLDDSQKIFSTEFNIIYVQEATEIPESTWEALTTRLRWNKSDIPYNQLIGDCNPASQRHWIMLRHKRGTLNMIPTFHKDNPALWNEKEEEWTALGQDYMSTLQNLTGTMRARMYEGQWVGAEGACFNEYDYEINLIDKRKIPKHWDRYISVDFGYTNPFVAQWWAKDEDGRLFMYRELYGIQRPVEDWAHDMYELSKDEDIRAIICDQDQEDRATLERHMAHPIEECFGGRQKEFYKVPKRKVHTTPADKRKESVRTGIEQVNSRFKLAGDGKPRLFLMRDSLVGTPDIRLEQAKKPTRTEEEIAEYVWEEVKNSRYGERILEQPKKVNDHGCDALRYMVRYIDGQDMQVSPNIWGSRVRNHYGGSKSTGDAVDILKRNNKSSFWTR